MQHGQYKQSPWTLVNLSWTCPVHRPQLEALSQCSIVNLNFIYCLALVEKQRFVSPEMRQTYSKTTQKCYLRRTWRRVRRTSCVNEHQDELSASHRPKVHCKSQMCIRNTWRIQRKWISLSASHIRERVTPMTESMIFGPYLRYIRVEA